MASLFRNFISHRNLQITPRSHIRTDKSLQLNKNAFNSGNKRFYSVSTAEIRPERPMEPNPVGKVTKITTIIDTTTDSDTKETKTTSQTTTTSFYKRPLPSHLIPFSSEEGREIFKKTIQNGSMESYWSLAEQFHTQSEPAYCGLATLTMVLNALQIDPNRLWKGPWRWYNEDLLDCCTPLEVVKKEGITMNNFACLAKCNGADIETVKAENTNLEEFRKRIRSTCEKKDEYIVVSFSRTILGQTGDGHFSAISAYNEEKDMCLVMDTAKFKYPAFWSPVSLLYDAMIPKDKVTGLSRGFFILKKSFGKASCGSSSCSTNKETKPVVESLSPSDTVQWTVLSHYLSHRLPVILRETKPLDVEGFIKHTLKYLPKDTTNLLREIGTTDKVYHQIRNSEIYRVTKHVMDEDKNGEIPSLDVEGATLLLMSSPSQVYKELSPELKTNLKELRDIDTMPMELSQEVIKLRHQMLNFAWQCGCKKPQE
eukprot:TRINITY_DN7689_c0_g1_i1.p1 TRINITY_DN7689_c0_g1~~TRINITY_DN7689_c0_g1_i1.p1  ORF type:complete len:483 (-),score=128.80 TRINITY_DN7689_c0_g1_i1:199-1647(-)